MMSGDFFWHHPHLRRRLFAGMALLVGATAFTAGLAGVILAIDDGSDLYGLLAVATALWCLVVVVSGVSLWRLVRDCESEIQGFLVRELGVAAAGKAQHEAGRKRRHDLANALTAIEGAAMILDREAASLTAQDRSTLTKVLESGTARLRRLLQQEDAGEVGRQGPTAGEDGVR